MKKVKFKKLHSTTTLFRSLVSISLVTVSLSSHAQAPTKMELNEDGELENVEVIIDNERQITLPAADRNFEKIPPRASEPIKPPITYDFKSFNFQAPQINPQIRPLKLKQQEESNLYGGYLRVGYGNYVSPLIEGYYNTR